MGRVVCWREVFFIVYVLFFLHILLCVSYYVQDEIIKYCQLVNNLLLSSRVMKKHSICKIVITIKLKYKKVTVYFLRKLFLNRYKGELYKY